MAMYPTPKSGNDIWQDISDYNRALMRQLQEETQQHWEFMGWLKMTHPEALIEWQALNKIKES